MNRRPLCQILCFFFISFVGTYHKRYAPICIALFLSLLFVLCAEHLYKKQYRRLWVKLAFVFAMLGAGILIAFGVKKTQQAEYHCFENKAFVSFQGTVWKKETKNEKIYYYLKDCFVEKDSLSKNYSKLILVQNRDTIQIGKKIYGTAFVYDFMKARNEGGFDEENYYKSMGISLRLTAKTITKICGRTDLYAETLYHLKNRLLAFYIWAMPPKEAGVLSVMLLGDKTYLDSDVKTIYQKTGISHVLSISGLHISIIGIGIFSFLRKIGRSYWFSGVISFALVYTFGTMSGFHVSAKRAVFMFAVAMFGRVIGRTYDAVSALTLVAGITIMTEPYSIDYSGFLFSYFAVIGILVVGSMAQRCVKKRHKIWDAILMSISIECMIMPLVALSNYEIPVYVVLINFIILPFMEAVIGIGIVGGLVGMIVPFFGKKMLWFVVWILRAYEWIGNFFCSLPHATYITGKPSENRILLYFACLSVFLILAYIFQKKLILLSGFLLCMFLLLQRPTQKFEIDVLDVGQGDGIFVHMGKTSNLFIDGGSTSQKNVGTYTILPFLKAKGIDKIDYWFVSHGDTDHISGLLEVMNSSYTIENVVLSKDIVIDSAYEKITDTAKKNGIGICFMKKGDLLKEEDVSIKAVFPDDQYVNDDRNAKSLVLLLEKGNFKALFTGDISSEEETRILSQTNLPQISFYKAAHHGSKYSNSKAFLESLKPQVAAISCSETNRYGHPGKEAIEHMQAEHTKIYYTMKQGQIKLYFDKKQDEKQKKKQQMGQIGQGEEDFYISNYLNPLEVHFYPVLK